MKCIILAGGSGSRLWPVSREMYPKQMLNFGTKESLIEQTFRRLKQIPDVSEIVTASNILNYQNIKLKLNKLDPSNIVIAEPLSKNTAPAIACSLEYYRRNNTADDIVLITPSDLIINNNKQFMQSVENAKNLAQDGYIVTFGVKPSYPESGYGYIKTGKSLNIGFEVEKFIEKPDYETARKYFKSGEYYWNSGIFMSKISVLLEEFKTLSPDIYSKLSKFDYSNDFKLDFDTFNSMPSISIDYAIMEKSSKIAMTELLSDWVDVGSWQSLYKVKQKDENGNVITGKVVTDNVRNSLIYSQKELVAVSDLEDVIIVETEDAIMACKMDKSQDVKKLYDKLKTQESDTAKLHKTVFRPWGYYTCMNRGEGYLTKTICVLPHQKLSVQSHNHRSEHWVVLEGTALVLKDGKEYNIYPGGSIDIPVGAKHSLQNPYEEDLKIIEVQKGDYISEDDIIRYEDCYGRV